MELPFARLGPLCESQGWRLHLALGAPRPDLRPPRDEFVPHDLVLEVHIPASPPPIAVVAPAERPLSEAAAVCLKAIRDR